MPDFFNFYGQHGARLGIHSSVRGQVDDGVSLLGLIGSYSLLHTPCAHIRELKNLWIDGRVVKKCWTAFVKSLNAEWTSAVTYSMLVLCANIILLAVPFILPGLIGGVSSAAPTTERPSSLSYSVAQLFSFISVLLSAGSAILGLLFIRQHRGSTHKSADDAADYLQNVANSGLGLESLAMTYSLPHAFLLWSLLSFTVAVCVVCFQGMNALQQIISGAVAAAIALPIAFATFRSCDPLGSSSCAGDRTFFHLPSVRNLTKYLPLRGANAKDRTIIPTHYSCEKPDRTIS